MIYMYYVSTSEAKQSESFLAIWDKEANHQLFLAENVAKLAPVNFHFYTVLHVLHASDSLGDISKDTLDT